MADNRHFTNALQNEGSSPVYVEDKKLAERTPVSGAASIANLKFLLVNDDTEGFNTAIKAYIDEAIRSALGALVNNLDKGTAISRILATDGNSDLGTISPANLASVLGVLIGGYINGQSISFDTSHNWCIRIMYTSGLISGKSDAFYVVISFYTGSSLEAAIGIPVDDRGGRLCYYGHYIGWNEI